jgi:CarD family transcriptional regulator
MAIMNFLVGEKVVYPNQGVGVIEKINTCSFSGQTQSFYQLKIVANSLMVMVPVANVGDVGLRRLIKKEEVTRVIEYLREKEIASSADWKNRFKENSEKMRSGCIFEVADVLKSLAILGQGRTLSFREKKMLEKARFLLVSELAIVGNIPLEKVEEKVSQALLHFAGIPLRAMHGNA